MTTEELKKLGIGMEDGKPVLLPFTLNEDGTWPESSPRFLTTVLPLSKVDVNKGQVPGLPKNPRVIKNDKFNALKKSIKEDPEMLDLRELMVFPFIIGDDVKYILIGGNMRLRAMRELMKEMSFDKTVCKVLHSQTPIEKLKAYLLKDNGSYGEWDFKQLLEDFRLDQITDAAIDIPDIFTNEEEEEEPEAQEDNFDVEAAKPKNPKAKVGDIYQLGDHRLLCGDSTMESDVKALFDGDLCNLIVTDPPYNVDYVSKLEMLGRKGHINIANDKMSSQGFKAFMHDAYSNMFSVQKPGGSIYVFHASREVVTFVTELEGVGYDFKQMLIWAKNAFVLGRQDYQWKHEPIIYGYKPGAAHYFIDSRKLTTLIEDQPDLDSMGKKELLQYVRDFKEKIEQFPHEIIHENKPMASDDHPTMKPVKLVGRLISNSSRQGDLVFDPFAGSGTTLIASEQLGRKCYTIEYEPVYIDVIIKRWQELTGKKAKLLGNIRNETPQEA